MQQESTPRTDSVESDIGYAELRIKKSSIKWLAVFAVVLFVVFLGLLLASVIISSGITKDVQVKNGQLVSSKDETTPVKTSDVLYTQKVNLDTPLDIVQSVKSLSVNTDKGIFKMQVVGFKRIPGVELVFHGHTHSASIKADGSVEIIKTFVSNNKRSVEVRWGNYAQAHTSLYRQYWSPIKYITHCNNLTNLDEDGIYRLSNDLTCTLSGPLNTFKGLFNGNGKTLTINMNTLGSSNEEVALFRSLSGAGVFNLELKGSFEGRGRCAGFAVQARPGTSLISLKLSATVVCHAPSSGLYAAAPFVAELKSSNNGNNNGNITFQYLLSAGNIVNDENTNPWLAGFVAYAAPGLNVVTRFNYFLSYYPNLLDPHNGYFSIFANIVGSGRKKRDYCEDNNINSGNYQQRCWQEFNYTGGSFAYPTDLYWECCETWNYCTGCMYYGWSWEDHDMCRFSLGCMGKKRSDTNSKRTTITRENMIEFGVSLPIIEQPSSS